MDGNITQEGITLDLQWMKRVGIGGMQVFDGALLTPKVVGQRLGYMTPEWKAAFRHATSLAGQLDLELAIASSAGWSSTGGPWVQPNQAMKKLVWSETRLTGGQPFHGGLAQPPSVTGPFQNIPKAPNPLVRSAASARTYYADSLVVAYRSASSEETPLRASSNTGPVNPADLSAGDRAKIVKLTGSANDPSPWIQLEYAQPFTARAATVATAASVYGPPRMATRLEASEDGEKYLPVADLPIDTFVQKTVSFAPVTARYFRLSILPDNGANAPFANFAKNAAPGAAMFPLPAPPKTPTYTITAFALHSDPRVHHFEEKAGFAATPDYYAIASPPSSAAVRKADVVDLTGRMAADGTLDWTPPPGRWVVLRFGYSLTGHENGPAPAEATGLEVDKLNRGHIKTYLDHYLGMYADIVAPEQIGQGGIRAFLTDSIEAGAQNWTDDMIDQFRRLRGYDPTPWLPVLTGIVIESAEESDKFLWDFRRTIAQLISEGYYRTIAAETRARGLTLYGEALEDHRPQLGDDMEMRRHTDVPMGAMWSFRPETGPNPTYIADLRGAASVAHLYGQNLAAAESMTSALAPWAFAPRDLKPIIDLEFALGVNRPVIHTSVHQPLPDRKPGLTLFIFGQYFNRNETWAEQAQPWVSYLTRSAYLLQQGRFFADVAYFYGEESPLTGLYGDRTVPDAPEGHGYDFVNSDVILNLLTVDDGVLTTPSGMRYRVLYLGGSSSRMTLAVLRKLRDLVTAGAVVVGNRPLGSPSLADDETQFRLIADQLWRAEAKTVALGQGRVIANTTVNDALSSLGLARDFASAKAPSDAELMFLHRQLDDGEVYFITNRKARAEVFDGLFRITGKQVEIWHAETGATERASFRIEGEQTIVPLRLAANESVFVVFRQPAATASYTAPQSSEIAALPIAGGWQVLFQPGYAAEPMTTTFDQLRSWAEDADAGVKYFSGTATYTKTIEVPAGWIKAGVRQSLDLGDVRELAEVSVNGRSLGILWNPPFKIDVTDVLKPGANTLEVKVTNLWVNRLIGDKQPDVTTKHTFAPGMTYKPGAPLRPSGLLGPVILSTSEFR